jgi:hypothetical protein
VTITGVDDLEFDGPTQLSIVTNPAKSGDMAYTGSTCRRYGHQSRRRDTGVIVTPLGGLVT